MLIPLIIGSLMVMGNMCIQILVMLFVVRSLLGIGERFDSEPGLWRSTWQLSMLVLALFLGHVLQFATWAALFVYLGEFPDYTTAFYHSTVNFTSLGYGDIVMSEHWRMLGALEAANGVLMFGLSAGAILSVINWMINQRGRAKLEGRKAA